MQKVTAFIFGDVTKQLKEKTWQCWSDLLVGDTENMEYLNFLSRGGLQIPLQVLTDSVCLCFSVIEVNPTITYGTRAASKSISSMFPLKSVSLFKCLVHLTQQ